MLKALNKVMYILFAVSLVTVIASFVFICICGIIRLFSGEAVMFLAKWRIAILGDSILMMLISAFVSNQIDKGLKKKAE